MSTPVIDPVTLLQVDALLARYCRALDARDMRTWLDCFLPQDSSYELTTLENVRMELPVGLMLDDCYERLQDRVKYVEEVWNHAVEHYQTRHLWTRAQSLGNSDGSLSVNTHFAVFYTNVEGRSGLLGNGEYQDTMTQHGGALRLRSRRAILDTAVPPRYLIYPV